MIRKFFNKALLVFLIVFISIEVYSAEGGPVRTMANVIILNTP